MADTVVSPHAEAIKHMLDAALRKECEAKGLNAEADRIKRELAGIEQNADECIAFANRMRLAASALSDVADAGQRSAVLADAVRRGKESINSVRVSVGLPPIGG